MAIMDGIALAVLLLVGCGQEEVKTVETNTEQQQDGQQ